MSRLQNMLLNLVALILVAIGLIWIIYTTFIGGTTSGPDFIDAVKSGRLTSDSVSTIEVVEPPLGYTPFSAKEYDSLPRRKKITDEATISRIITLLSNFRSGRVSQNHPSMMYHVYLKMNCQDGFFWLYVDVYQDAESSILQVDANTRNAVNPNGASIYHTKIFSELLRILQRKKEIDPQAAASKSE